MEKAWKAVCKALLTTLMTTLDCVTEIALVEKVAYPTKIQKGIGTEEKT
jgi:hypothetical protein